MTKKATNKRRKHKDKERKRSNIKTRNKKRANGINKASRRAACSNVERIFLPRLQIYHQGKQKRTWHTKSGKNAVSAYYFRIIDKKGAQYSCETSVLCVYCRVPASQYPHPFCMRIPLRCRFSIFIKIFFLIFFYFFNT